MALAWPQNGIFLVTSTSTSAVTWPTRKIQAGMCALGYLHTSAAQGLQPVTEMSCSPGKQEAHLGRRRVLSIYLGLFVHSSMSVGHGWAALGLFEVKE